MSDGASDQSMEDILASIKRVISADAAAARRLPPARPAAPIDEDDVLELGEPPAQLVSSKAEQQSRAALASLAGLSIDPQGANNTLDGLVRELLRPMLKQWLDQNLPDLVERIVAREVARITGR
jgi:hypothetical protein